MSSRTPWWIVASIAAVATVVLGGIIVDSAERQPAPAGAGPLVGFYGDSYTLGTGASDPSKRWSTVISKERGWREYNPSVNGLGFVNNRSVYGPGDLPDRVIQQHPGIVFVTMGLNDNFAYASFARKIEGTISFDLGRLRKALPEARIIVVEPFWYTDYRPHSLEVISGWVKDAAAVIDADYIPGASHWIEHHPEWMASDGLHPNDEGYAAMAVKMDAALKKLGL
jgi:lysophospholipase L1-like esterase